MKALVMDFETYYDDEYSLSKMTTQEYVYFDKFKIHGVGLATVDLATGEISEPYYFDNFVSVEDLIKQLKQESNFNVVCHNAIFEGNILARLGYVPDFIIDTASMSRAVLGNTLGSHSLGSVSQYLFGIDKLDGLSDTKGLRELPSYISDKLAEYCKRDVELTAKIAVVLFKYMPPRELVLCDLVSRMAFDNYIKLDRERIESYYNRVIERKKTVFARAGVRDVSELRKREVFAETLRKFGVKPPTKISPTTGKETYAFAKNDPEIKALLEHPNPDIQALVAAKLESSSTIEETRAARFLRLAQFSHLGVPYRYSGAVQTHRLSGGDKLNMQNLPRGGGLRSAIRAREGRSLVVSDLSQIELRVTLAMAGHYDALDVLRRGDDLYCWFASKMYGKEINAEDHPNERQIAKSAVLGCGFGMGASKFMTYAESMGVSISPTEAESIVAGFRNTFHLIPRLWKTIENVFKTQMRGVVNNVPVIFDYWELPNGAIEYGFQLPCGLKVKYPNLSYDNDNRELYFVPATGREHLFGGKLVENLAQSIARNIMFDKALEIASSVEDAKLVMTTHDELVYAVPSSRLEECVEQIHRIMSAPVDWWPDVPLAAKTSHGTYYGEIK